MSFWDDQPVSQRLPSHLTQEPQPQVHAAEQYMEEAIEEFSEPEEDESYAEVLADANLRIQQGQLYQMIMNSDLFSQMDVDQRAIDNVQREIRRYAKERMEIMLGMRQEVAKESVVSSPFDDTEVMVLKKFAAKVASGLPESEKVQRPLVQAPQKPTKTNTITPVGPQKTTPVRTPQRPIQAKQQPIKRQRAPQTIEEAAMMDANYKPLEKDPATMTDMELAQRAKESANRQSAFIAARISDSAVPMPSVDQMNMAMIGRADVNLRGAQKNKTPGLSGLTGLR